MTNGWDESAAAWIADMDDAGEFSRRHVLDPVMRKHAAASGTTNALDVGCGEGRFCRMLRDMGIEATGLEPTKALIAERHLCRGRCRSAPLR
jgi:2-polyprenyl-3-methyl-5-hydroxy-6-metoxy-1,4-benzoquinol methylase